MGVPWSYDQLLEKCGKMCEVSHWCGALEHEVVGQCLQGVGGCQCVMCFEHHVVLGVLVIKTRPDFFVWGQ